MKIYLFDVRWADGSVTPMTFRETPTGEFVPYEEKGESVAQALTRIEREKTVLARLAKKHPIYAVQGKDLVQSSERHTNPFVMRPDI